MRCDVRAAVAQIKIKEGMIQESSGSRYEGQVNQDGQLHGKGVWSGSSGYRYVGEWRNNLHHGPGTCTYADGRVQSGQWENMKFLG